MNAPVKPPAQLIEEAADVVRDELAAFVRGTQEALAAAIERAESAEARAEEAENELKAEDEKAAGERADLLDTLSDVRYWLQDVLSLGKPAGDPRPLLRKVERLLQDFGE